MKTTQLIILTQPAKLLLWTHLLKLLLIAIIETIGVSSALLIISWFILKIIIIIKALKLPMLVVIFQVLLIQLLTSPLYQLLVRPWVGLIILLWILLLTLP